MHYQRTATTPLLITVPWILVAIFVMLNILVVQSDDGKRQAREAGVGKVASCCQTIVKTGKFGKVKKECKQVEECLNGQTCYWYYKKLEKVSKKNREEGLVYLSGGCSADDWSAGETEKYKILEGSVQQSCAPGKYNEEDAQLCHCDVTQCNIGELNGTKVLSEGEWSLVRQKRYMISPAGPPITHGTWGSSDSKDGDSKYHSPNRPGNSGNGPENSGNGPENSGKGNGDFEWKPMGGKSRSGNVNSESGSGGDASGFLRNKGAPCISFLGVAATAYFYQQYYTQFNNK